MAAKRNYCRPAFFAAAAALHLVLLFSLAFTVESSGLKGNTPRLEVMKLTDLAESQEPPPQNAPGETLPQALPSQALPSPQGRQEPREALFPPERQAGALAETTAAVESGLAPEAGGVEYLPIHRVSKPPSFEKRTIQSRLRYPPAALRFNIEGVVNLELFVDRDGVVRRVVILREDPPGRGFGEAALRAFEELKGTPAELNGIPAAVRYRYPLHFTIR